MNLASDYTGRALQTALMEQPSLTLDFYSYGVMLRKREGETMTEYPVDPAQIAAALAAKVRFETGLLCADTLFVRYEGVKQLVVSYRKPQKTGMYLEGSETPLRVPLPGLILVRQTTERQHPDYHLYAVKRRPQSLDAALFHAPLPNIYTSGSICWGTVRTVSEAALAGTSLAEDWQMLLGSPFGNHSVHGKSRAHRDDIRQQLIALTERNARVYPTSDLVPVRKTLVQLLGAEK